MIFSKVKQIWLNEISSFDGLPFFSSWILMNNRGGAINASLLNRIKVFFFFFISDDYKGRNNVDREGGIFESDPHMNTYNIVSIYHFSI